MCVCHTCACMCMHTCFFMCARACVVLSLLSDGLRVLWICMFEKKRFLGFHEIERVSFYFCSDGGYFNAIMTFPQNYPNSPPSVRFTSEMWHPNGELIASWLIFMSMIWSCLLTMHYFELSVYPDGRVCISILHPPGEDPNGYELASERWTPVHTVGFL